MSFLNSLRGRIPPVIMRLRRAYTRRIGHLAYLFCFQGDDLGHLVQAGTVVVLRAQALELRREMPVTCLNY